MVQSGRRSDGAAHSIPWSKYETPHSLFAMLNHPTLDRALIEDVLNELGTLARAEGQVIKLAIYGGSALALASNFRTATRDLDAVADDEGQRVIERLAVVIAKRRGWNATWLNDDVFPYLSDNVAGVNEHHAFLRSYPSDDEPGVRVYVPTPEYLLALKLMAMRIGIDSDAKDRTDIVNLLAIVGLASPEEVVNFVVGFYPEAKVSAKVLKGIEELFRAPVIAGEDTRHEAPRYLGRGRASH